MLRALGLGDLCTAVPALRGLRRAFPDHVIQLAAPAWLEALVALVEAVDEHLEVEGLVALPAPAGGAEVAVNLHGRGPQSTRRLVESRPHRLVAFAHPAVPESSGGPPWRDGEHEVVRWCRLLDHAGVTCDPDELALAPPPRVGEAADSAERAEQAPAAGAAVGANPTGMAEAAVVIHVGASAPARRWPPARWSVVARALSGDGHRVLLTGGAEDRPAAVRIARAAELPTSAVLAGSTDLATLLRLVATARLVICGDTGVAHLATAFTVPSVILFGPVPPAEWGPRRGPHTTLWAGRRGDPHASTADEGLLRLSADQVVGAARTRLA